MLLKLDQIISCRALDLVAVQSLRHISVNILSSFSCRPMSDQHYQTNDFFNIS